MATIRTRLKELRDVDVQFISLVDRAATRIPFRVLKREDSKMGIDLTKVFKSDQPVKPHVSALVVFAHKNEAVAKEIEEAITAHGFSTDRVQKSDEGETLVFAQGDQSAETHVVRLSDQTLVSVGGLRVPEGWVGEWIEKHGFFPDVAMATSALHAQAQELVTKSENPQADAEALLTSYADYFTQIIQLPTACFKLDDAITAIIKKCSCEEKKDEKKDEVVKESPEDEEARKKRIASQPPAETTVADEDADQQQPEGVVKADVAAILTTLKGIEERTTSMAAKLETVATEQAAQKIVLDGVVQKAETLTTTLKTTVTAVPVAEDRPAGPRMRTQKSEDDPRSGNFDTAFLRRRR